METQDIDFQTIEEHFGNTDTEYPRYEIYSRISYNPASFARPIKWTKWNHEYTAETIDSLYAKIQDCREYFRDEYPGATVQLRVIDVNHTGTVMW